MKEQLIFKFRNSFGSRFFLDGASYIFVSMKPALRIGEFYTAKYLDKENSFIQAVIVDGNEKPIIHAVIEIK